MKLCGTKEHQKESYFGGELFCFPFWAFFWISVSLLLCFSASPLFCFSAVFCFFLLLKPK